MVFNIFKRKKKGEKGEDKSFKEEGVKIEEKEKEIKNKTNPAQITGSGGLYFKLIKSPHVSEKTGIASEQGQYVFKVFNDANKSEIKKSIERAYNVKVKKINTIYVPPKKRQVGKHEGTRPGYKKAIIILKKGYSMEINPQ